MFNVAWLMPLAPLTAFVVIALGGHRSRRASAALAVGSMGVALVIALGVFWPTVRAPAGYHVPLGDWFRLGAHTETVGVLIDPTNAVMVAMVSLLCLLIFVYSIGYMHGEPRASRFFAYVSLFAAAMLGAMTGDNLLVFFLCWEIMGICSYLLIGFYVEKPGASAAGLKAFIVTKTGDLFLLLGLVLLYAQAGSLAYADIFAPDVLQRMAATPYLGGLSTATVATLLLFAGTMTKSAQFPLHVWLPDAMAGPTPASALIHAATMVSAGVYLMIRAFPLLALSQALPVLAVVGTLTALFAAVVAIAQHDIKRVLAFSTISQLGYMVAALGVGGYAAALFHLIVHAFFKALLFLAAGSVIHGVEHGEHQAHGHAVRRQDEEVSPNDMRRMGGLAFRMPVTAVAFLAGSLALSGFPVISAGFWSKDEILAEAWGANRLVFWGLAAAAAMTAFYSARQLALVFLGKPRSRAAVFARESRPTMTVPLAILAVFAVTLGWAGIPESFPGLGRLVPNWFAHFVEVSLHPYAELLGTEGHGAGALEVMAWQPLVISIVLALGGLVAGLVVYRTVRPPDDETVLIADPVAAALDRARLGRLYAAMQAGFYLDAFYQRFVVQPAVKFAQRCYALDHEVIDAAVVAVATGISQSGFTPALNRIDGTVVDGTLLLLSRLSRDAAELLSRIDTGLIDRIVRGFSLLGRTLSGLSSLLDRGVVDGLVRGTAGAFREAGRGVRRMQSGILPDYLWNAFMMILLLVAALVLLQRI